MQRLLGFLSVHAMRVAGPNVTPFNTAKQTVLILALASIMTTVTQDEIGMILVVAATSTSRRRLLSLEDLSSLVRAAIHGGAASMCRRCKPHGPALGHVQTVEVA